MMERRTRIVVAAWLATATVAIAQNPVVGADYSGSYLCKTLAAGGVAPLGGGDVWQATTFDVSDDTYLVKVADTGKRIDNIFETAKERVYVVGVKKFGTKDESVNCYGKSRRTEGAEVVSTDGEMNCVFIGTEYLFDFKTMRFQTMFRGGYMDGSETNRDTPYVSVGKCDKIE
jgi:hypothetical protein